jgi:hypothetical protein
MALLKPKLSGSKVQALWVFEKTFFLVTLQLISSFFFRKNFFQKNLTALATPYSLYAFFFSIFSLFKKILKRDTIIIER